jgi:kynurenine formamidase
MLQFFDGLKAEDLPDGQGWAVEMVQLSTHNGTHLDAPWHFHPTMNRGERSWTIDEVPLEWCLQPGVKLDFRHLPDGYVATASDVETELKRIGHTLSPLEIVLVNTSAGAKYGRQDYVTSGCGMGYEATMYLLERGVRLTGIDGWSWDAPFVYTAKKYAETKDASLIWEGHKAGRHIGLTAQSRATAVDRFHRVVLSGQDRTRVGGLDPRGGNHRWIRARDRSQSFEC